MSRTAVIVALLVLAGLGLGAYFLMQRGAGASVSGPLLSFDPARVIDLRVEVPNEPARWASRTTTGPWTISSDHDPEGWPASETQVRAALRLLSTLVPTRPADATPSPAARLTLTVDGPSVVTALIGTRPLAGQVVLETYSKSGEVRRGWVGVEIADMLITTGLSAWRDPAALPGLGPDTSAIALRGEKGSVELARREGRWVLLAPVSAPAEPDAVARLTSRLAKLRVAEFLDGPTPPDAGIDASSADITISSQFREPSVPPRLIVQETSLRLGRASDLSGRSRLAEIKRSTRSGSAVESASRAVVIDATALGELSTDPAAYVSRRVLRSGGSDVGMIRVTPASGAAWTLARTIDGWDGGASVFAGSNASAAAWAASVIQLMTEVDAVEIRIAGSTDRPGPEHVIASVELESIGGAALGRWDLVEIGDPAATRIGLRRERTTHVYSDPLGEEVAVGVRRR